MNNIFTFTHPIQGNVGIGTIPYELHSFLLFIFTHFFFSFTHPLNHTSFHTYYFHLPYFLKHSFDTIQFHHFWNYICSLKCIKICVTEMNEIYYSNPKPNFEKTNLYGAAANLIPHRDCILFNFDGISFYRVIIGLSNNNNDTSTELIHFNLEHKLNQGDYMIFDFDKTLHQVKKFGQQETPRLLLKLHFIVCENCKYSEKYVKFISNFYICYYYIARYTEQIGTDPETFLGFFFGLIWEWGFYSAFKYISSFLLLSIFIINLKCKMNVYHRQRLQNDGNGNIQRLENSNGTIESFKSLKLKDIGNITLFSLFSLFIIYLWIVSFYYFRYILFNIK